MILIGVPIGFYGNLLPSNINLMALELYSTKRYQLLIVMFAMIVLFESIYCVVSLTLIKEIKGNTESYSPVELVSYLLIFIMGLWILFERKIIKQQPIKIQFLGESLASSFTHNKFHFG